MIFFCEGGEKRIVGIIVCMNILLNLYIIHISVCAWSVYIYIYLKLEGEV